MIRQFAVDVSKAGLKTHALIQEAGRDLIEKIQALQDSPKCFTSSDFGKDYIFESPIILIAFSYSPRRGNPPSNLAFTA
jgi:hypothetical protein